MNHINHSNPFEDAVLEANAILARHAKLAEEERSLLGNWFGRKVFLGYREGRGWKVYELSFFEQILRRLKVSYQDTRSSLVLKKLEDLTAEEISFASNTQLAAAMPKLKEKLDKIYDEKVRAPKTPDALIRQRDLIKTPLSKSPHLPKLLFHPSPSKESSKPTYLKPDTPLSHSLKIQDEKIDKSEEIKQAELIAIEPKIKSISNLPPPALAPLYLRNYRATRCYIDSVLELMLSQDDIRKRIFEQCAREDIPHAHKEFLEKLRDLILIAHETRGTGTGSHSPMGAHSPAEKVREAIVAHALLPDLSDPTQIYTQQDASFFLLLINELLGNSFQSQVIDTAIRNKKNHQPLIEIGPIATNYKLELFFNGKAKSWWHQKGNSLKDMLDQCFASKEAVSSRNIPEKRKFHLLNKNKKIASLPFKTQTHLIDLPNLFTLHLGRSGYNIEKGELFKVTDPVILPRDGIVDMAPYYLEKKSNSDKYEITGYVIHHGGNLTSGHYTANIKIGNKFYACDDMNLDFHHEISAETFYGNKNAYLVMLKRIPNEPPSGQAAT